MGLTKSKADPYIVDILIKETHYNRQEVLEWSHGFYKACPDGFLSMRQFQDMYAHAFNPLASRFANHVFRCFDKDKDGVVSFYEFVVGMSVTSRGSLREKLQFIFGIYDINGDGFISQDEMLTVLMAFYNTMEEEPNWPKDETANERTEKIFKRFDLNNDGFLSMDEFLHAVKKDPFMLLVGPAVGKRS